ncbi:hypothetical protein BDZ97DRAFT_1780750 [Flammula alnicola]|nr:hypothetical protein BDZ97DRAFT_1780750 [Flammula alnicola]
MAHLAVDSFFTEVRVIGGENVPKDGPIIVTATHHNMMLDPVILSVGFPYRRMLNYWSKASLFAHPVMRWILFSSGNIPVDRKSKDRQVLFKGTIEALCKGEAVALFPEGTSYTEPRIMQVKDGAAWAAMEYTKWAKENPGKTIYQDVKIIPVSIVYTNKSKFGQPISLDPYKEQFFSDAEGAPRAAVKRVTRRIETELVETSINAPDWDTLYAARMARDLLWEKERSINLEDFVAVSQTLVDLFSNSDITPNFKTVKRNLLGYYSLLQSSHLSNSLPFFFIPLIVHIPVYIMGRIGARLVENEEETQAQNKVAFGLLSLLLIYPATFFFLWALFRYTPTGALLAAFLVYLFAVYHIRMIDGKPIKYLARRFIAAWRVLVGVWTPKHWDLSASAVSQYMKPKTPPVSAWIDRPTTPKTPPAEPEEKAPQSLTDFNLQEEPPVKARSARRPPSRRLVRHVLRSRVEAVNALAGFFDHLTRNGTNKKVTTSSSSGADDSLPEGEQEGWRYAAEVVTFLRNGGPLTDEWAAPSSEGEEEPIWVPRNAD